MLCHETGAIKQLIWDMPDGDGGVRHAFEPEGSGQATVMNQSDALSKVVEDRGVVSGASHLFVEARRTPNGRLLIPSLNCNNPVCLASSSESPVPEGDVLRQLGILPVPFTVAKTVLVAHHYLHSIAAGTQLCFGVFVQSSLMGAATLGAGPFLAYQLVDLASPDDCLTLTRFWLDDRLPPNSESKALGILLRALKRNTRLKFLVSYADPAVGHVGSIYAATNWVYTGLSQATPVYSLGDGKLHHSRSLAHAFGTHSVPYLKELMVPVSVLMQPGKHRYLYFLDPSWRSRLLAPVLPYPKKVTP